jgi:hypothetical protein
MNNPSGVPIEQPKRQAMAIASLIIGTVGMVTCGIAGVGAIAGIILGAVALTRASKHPAIYGGKKLAIAGIIVSTISPFPCITAAIAVHNLLKSQQAADELLKSHQAAHETAAIENVKAIGRAQALYSVTTGRGRYGDMATLAAQGDLDSKLAAGEKWGYVFATTPVNVPGMPPMFDTTAIPITTGRFGTGNRSFASNETNVIYEAEGSVELKGTPANREPRGGTPLDDNQSQPGSSPYPRIPAAMTVPVNSHA